MLVTNMQISFLLWNSRAYYKKFSISVFLQFFWVLYDRHHNFSYKIDCDITEKNHVHFLQNYFNNFGGIKNVSHHKKLRKFIFDLLEEMQFFTGQLIYRHLHRKKYTKFKFNSMYSQTWVQWPPWWPWICGRYWQLVVVKK